MKDIKFEYMRGKGPGGQHRNKTSSMVRATHTPTGIQVTIDGRDQHKNKKMAIKELQKRLKERSEEVKAEKKKARRDELIHDNTIIRTYRLDGVVDHRTGKKASWKDIIGKGKLDKLQ